MPVAALMGFDSETKGEAARDWSELSSSLGPARLGQDRIAWYGLRDVDPAERKVMKGLPITMHDVDRRGIERTVESFDTWMRGTGVKHLWISFDVDALDPILAPTVV